MGMQEQMSLANCRVPKLNEHNYVRWKRDMSIYLKTSNLWDTVISAPPDPATADWTRKNQRAVAEIHNCCEPAQQDLFSDYETAWDKLKATFETRDSATIQRLYNDFNNFRKARDETMLTYIAGVKTTAKQLTNAGETVSTTNLLNKTISGLSDRYEAVKISLGMGSTLTEERLTQVLIAEESKSRDRRRSMSRERGRESERSDWYKQSERSKSRDRRRSMSRSVPTRARQRSLLRSSGRRSNFCKTCDMFGHDEETCFKLYPELLARHRAEQAAYLELVQIRRPQNTPPQQHAQGYAMPLQLNEDTVWDYYHTAMTMGQNGIDWNEVLLGACKWNCEDMTIKELREYWSAHFIISSHMLALIIEGDLRSCVALHRYNLAVTTEEAACWSAQDPKKPFAEENENERSLANRLNKLLQFRGHRRFNVPSH